MTVIVTKNSSTASAVPLTSDLVKGELAVNVTDKRIFTENASTAIVELGTNPSTLTTATATVTGVLTANGTLASSNAVLTGGTVNSTPIGATTPSTIAGTTVTASTGFTGGLTGDVTGNVTGNLTGNVTGNVTGALTGNVTAASGTTTLTNLVVNGTVDFTNTILTNLAAPVSATDAATKGYVDTAVSDVIAVAPAALDTLNELAAALGDDANFSTTVTNSIATKLPLAGGTMSGAIAMGTSKITGLGDPTGIQDAATKTYVDTADALKLPLAGGTMSGALAMGSNKITGLGTPTATTDATTKTYVDGILGSATAAATSASNAATSESNASTSASNAATSETNAATSETNAAASYDSFDDRYLGAKAVVPTLDNDGDALLTGALYFNTVAGLMYVYTGAAWTGAGSAVNGTAERQEYIATAAQTTFAATYDVGFVDVYLNGVKLVPTTDFTASNGTSVVLTTGATVSDNVSIIAYGSFDVANTYTQIQSDARFAQLTNNLSDLANAATARTNLGLAIGTNVQAYDATIVVDADLGVTVQAYDADTTKNDVANTFTADQIISGELTADSYNESYAAVTSTTNATTVSCEAGNTFTHVLTENTTFTFSAPPVTGTAYTFTLKVVQDASASGFTLTWPTSVDWPAATAPTLTATASAVDVFVFYTHDGGTTWYGFIAGQGLA